MGFSHVNLVIIIEFSWRVDFSQMFQLKIKRNSFARLIPKDRHTNLIFYHIFLTKKFCHLAISYPSKLRIFHIFTKMDISTKFINIEKKHKANNIKSG